MPLSSQLKNSLIRLFQKSFFLKPISSSMATWLALPPDNALQPTRHRRPAADG
jgi:hypothetical protein